jgi:hypothetical protein
MTYKYKTRQGFEVDPLGVLSTDGLVSYWPLNEAGGIRRDRVGQNHVYVTDPYSGWSTDLQYGGTSIYPAVVASTLHSGDAYVVSLDGNTTTDITTNRDRCLATNDRFPYHVNGFKRAYSIAGWVYVNHLFDDPTTSHQGMIAGNKNSMGSVPGSSGFGISQEDISGNNNFKVTNQNNNQNDAGLVSTVNLSLSTWYFVCVTWEESTGTRTITVNSTTESETVASTWNGIGTVDTTNRFLFGRQGNSTYPWTWPGYISNFSLWERALSADEITALYNNGTPNRLV